jgi:hypothetical protein
VGQRRLRSQADHGRRTSRLRAADPPAPPRSAPSGRQS